MNRKNGSSDNKRVGIWIRVSTEDQAKGESPQHHEERARQYAAVRGWTVVELYDLAGVSGKSVSDHPEAKRMLKDIQRGHITGLIFSKLARLARNTRELLEFADYFQKYDANLISLAEAMDTSTPVGRFFYTVLSAIASWEREEIADRVKASVPIRAKLGKHLGGKAPFGYQWKDKKLIPDPTTAPVRKLVHELYAKHKRKNAVARTLNAAGHRTQNGKPFTAAGIRIMLHDSTAKGLHRANYTTSAKGPSQSRLKSEEDWVYHEVEPIVSAELWDSCHGILLAQEAGERPKARRPVHPLAGKMVCGKCGEKMYIPSNTPKFVCRGCRHKMPIEDAEGIFLHEIKNYFVSAEQMKNYALNANEELQSKEALLASLQSERSKLKAEMDRTYRLFLDDGINQESFKARYRPMEDRWGQLTTEIPRLEGDIDYMKVNLMSGEEVFEQGIYFSERWPDLDLDERRRVVDLVLESLVVGDGAVEINVYFLPEYMTLDGKETLKEACQNVESLTTAPLLQATTSNANASIEKASAFSENVATSATTIIGP